MSSILLFRNSGRSSFLYRVWNSFLLRTVVPKFSFIGIIVLFPFCLNAQSLTLIADGEQRHQTMGGWGISIPGPNTMAFGSNPLAGFNFAPGEDDIFYSLLFDPEDGLGINYITLYQHWDIEGFWSGDSANTYEEVNDNDDPFVINWDGFNLHPDWPNWKIVEKSRQFGVVPKLQLGAVPNWMRTIDGFLREDMRDEFAEYLAVFLLYARDSLSMEIPLLTIANEPNNVGVGPFAAKYTPSDLAATMDRVARMLDLYGLNTLFVAPEVSAVSQCISYTQEFINNQEVTQRLLAISTHPYSGDDFSTWQSLADFAAQLNYPVWQGEFAAYSTDFSIFNALELSRIIIRHLVAGNVSVWYNFLGLGSTVGRDGGQEGALIIFTPLSGTDFEYFLPPRYYAFGQFSKFVRPGTVRIEATSSDEVVRTIAFAGPDKEFTLIAVNNDRISRNAVISLTNLPNVESLAVYRTSSREKGVQLDSVVLSDNTFTYNLTETSITTFTGEMSDSISGPLPPPEFAPQTLTLFQNYPNPFNHQTVIRYQTYNSSKDPGFSKRMVLKIFDSQGRTVRTLVDEFQPAGIYEAIWNGTDGAGRNVASGQYFYQAKYGDQVESKKMLLNR